jgi:hypothetical protein
MLSSLVVVRDAQAPWNDFGVLVGYGAVGVDVVPSPARVYNDGVGGREGDVRDETEERCETKHGGRMRCGRTPGAGWMCEEARRRGCGSKLLLATQKRRRRRAAVATATATALLEETGRRHSLVGRQQKTIAGGGGTISTLTHPKCTRTAPHREASYHARPNRLCCAVQA